MNTYTLQSITIFWKDLGIDDQNKTHKKQASEKWDLLEDWLVDNCQYSYRTYAKGVWFFDRTDAMLFKLRWNGMLIN